MRKDIKASCQKRLSRIEGQVRGLSKMVDEDRYCIDIVTQISAVRAALRRVEEEVLKDHVAHCVEHAISSGDKADQRAKIAELMAVIGRGGGEGLAVVIASAAKQSRISLRWQSGLLRYARNDGGNRVLRLFRSPWDDGGATPPSLAPARGTSRVRSAARNARRT